MMAADYSKLVDDLPRLVRIARAFGLSYHDAEDLVQAAVLRALPRWDAIGADPHPYLRTILTNLFIDGIRRKRVITEKPIGLFPDNDGWQTGDNADKFALRIDLDRELEKLPSLTRAVLILRFLDGQTISATAAILRRPDGTIARMTSEGLAALRRSKTLPNLSGRSAQHD